MAKAKEDVIEVAEMVKVELFEYKTGSTHTVYHKLGMTFFEDGVAEVTEDVAAVLKEAGLVK